MSEGRANKIVGANGESDYLLEIKAVRICS
jgi:hypothetical protein